MFSAIQQVQLSIKGFKRNSVLRPKCNEINNRFHKKKKKTPSI